MTPGDILAAYVATGHQYADLTRPYALHLIYLLSLLELATLAITYILDQGDLSAWAGRLVRWIFTTGFAYWWIQNSWWTATIVLGSFNQLGENITGQPDLTPGGFIAIATNIGKILYNAPWSAHYISDIGQAIATAILAFAIVVVLLLVAGLVIFTLAAAWLIIGPGSILVALLPNRFTSPISEGYFTWLIRTGVLLLFFFVVMGTAQSFAQQWSTTLTTECAVVGGTCTAPIPVTSLLTLLGSTIVLALICIGVPFTAAHIVGGGVNMAIEHIAAAKYLGGSISRSVGALGRSLSHRNPQSGISRTTLEQRLAAGASAASVTRPMAPPPSQIPTQKI